MKQSHINPNTWLPLYRRQSAITNEKNTLFLLGSAEEWNDCLHGCLSTMALLWIYSVLVAIFKIPTTESVVTYNLKEVASSFFSCYHDYGDSSRQRSSIKLFLPATTLVIICHLQDLGVPDTQENRRKNLLLYTSVGLAPSIHIFNSTYSAVFYFQMNLTLNAESWRIEIPRSKITFNTDVAPIEQWYLKFNMHHGLSMFSTDGSLLDIVREPILQWEIGQRVDIRSLIPFVENIINSDSPCATDVTVIGLQTTRGPSGVCVGMTKTGCMDRDVKWYNLSRPICSVLNYDCTDLRLVDIILTNNHLVVLTTLGLFISEDLGYRTSRHISFIKASFCGFEMDDYIKAKIWYNSQCLANRDYYEDDYISLTFNKDKTLSQESTCFYSNAPFQKWYSCLSHRTEAERRISKTVVTFLVDAEQKTGIALIAQRNEALVWVHSLTDHKLHERRKFPAFFFPDRTFKPTGMFFHPHSHFLYAYGNQVWMSQDGGNTFTNFIKLLGNETVVKTDQCYYSQAVIFVTTMGNVFFSKAGLLRYAQFERIPDTVFDLYFDHLCVFKKLTLNASSSDRLRVDDLSVQELLQADDFSFHSALVPQFLTEEQMIVFSHDPVPPPPPAPPPAPPSPRFQNEHIGKKLQYAVGGSGLISKLYPEKITPEFPSAVLVDILDRFPIESIHQSTAVANILTIQPSATPNSPEFRLHIRHSTGQHLQGFVAGDIEKTVTIPGLSSFLIIQIVNNNEALAHATMPDLVPIRQDLEPDQWFMYDFATTGGRQWKIVVDSCRYVVQQLEDLPINTVKYLDLGARHQFTFRISPINTPFPIFHFPQMRIIVGRPTLLDVSAMDYWDDTNSYYVVLTIKSNFYEEGKTTFAVVVTEASLLCDVTTLIITVKNSCSYLKAMHYVVPISISDYDWLSSDENQNEELAKVLKKLPVNYRPPSKMGINVPVTENFYNADPSKPKLRDYFVKSQQSGIYKQCAGKKNREDCGCTDNMKLSFSVAFSDCKEKAIRMIYPVKNLAINFTLEDADGIKTLSVPYFITIIEINNRTNWQISAPKESSSIIKIRKYLSHKLKTKLYDPVGLSLSLFGSELYHFRVSAIPGVAFCNLFDEFQIYVDESPLAFPGANLINGITAIFIGGMIFLAFMLHVYEINLGHVIKRAFRRNKVVQRPSVTTRSTISIETK